MILRYPKSIRIGDMVIDESDAHRNPCILLEMEWNPIGLVYLVKILRHDGRVRECTWASTWQIEVISEAG